MHSFSLLLAGAFAVQPILALPGSVTHVSDISKRSVDTFLASESPIALANLLCNIGSAGACASGAGSGLVMASPSKTSPDCAFPSSLVRFRYSHLRQTSTRGLATLL
jgi:glucoamylase